MKAQLQLDVDGNNWLIIDILEEFNIIPLFEVFLIMQVINFDVMPFTRLNFPARERIDVRINFSPLRRQLFIEFISDFAVQRAVERSQTQVDIR